VIGLVYERFRPNRIPDIEKSLQGKGGATGFLKQGHATTSPCNMVTQNDIQTLVLPMDETSALVFHRCTPVVFVMMLDDSKASESHR